MPPITFDNQTFSKWNETKKIWFGYFDYDEMFEPSKPVKEALLLAKSKLEKAGHESVCGRFA